MAPGFLDIKIIQLLAPLQEKPFWVDAIGLVSTNALFNGFPYAASLFLFWRSSEHGRSRLAQWMLLTILAATAIGTAGSLSLQHFFRWLPPATNPAVADIYSSAFRSNINPNSFPSDSAMLYSAVALGVFTWNARWGAALMAWLLLVVAPARVFSGSHFPTDIAAGLLLGFCSIRVARWLALKSSSLDALASSDSPLLSAVLFLWLFEVGNEFREVTDVIHMAWHIRRHL